MSPPSSHDDGKPPSAGRGDGKLDGAMDGERFERYRELGEGTIARTYLAVEHSGCGLRRLAVVKALHPRICADEARVTSLFERARELALRSSPFLAAVRGLGLPARRSSDEGAFIACAYVDGESLLAVLGRCTQLKRPPPLAVALALALDACAGLTALHRRGLGSAPMLHLAVRPSNLIVGYHGRLRLTDASLAASPEQLLLDAAFSPGLAQFIAPELLPQGDATAPVGASADLYALAAVLYTLLTLRFPHDETMLGELIAAKQQGSGVALGDRRRDLPPQLDELLRRALSPLLEERPESAEGFAEELATAGQPARDLEVARWLEELFGEQRPAQEQLLRRLLRPSGVAPAATPLTVRPTPVPAPEPQLVPRPMAETVQGDIDELLGEGNTEVGSVPAADPSRTREVPTRQPADPADEDTLSEPSQPPTPVATVAAFADNGAFVTPPPEERLRPGQASFGRTYPTAEVETSASQEDEGDTAVTALEKVFSDASTTRHRERRTAETPLPPPPMIDTGSTPAPEPAFGGEPNADSEADTQGLGRGSWGGSTTDITTIPFDDDEERTDVGLRIDPPRRPEGDE